MTATKSLSKEVLDYIRLHFQYNSITGEVKRDGQKLKRTARITLNDSKHKIRVYQIAWLLSYGNWPTEYIDHIDGDRANNRLANLRMANPSQNVYNRGKNTTSNTEPTTSQYKGVSYVKSRHLTKPWRATITVEYKQVHIGYYVTAEDAARAYDIRAQELFGDFACLNFGENNAVNRVRNGSV